MKMKLLFLDTETTGIENGRLVQLAMKSTKPGDKGENLYFKPAVPIEFEAMAVHHITNEKVADLPEFGEQKKAELQSMLDEYIMVAHNAIFDAEVLRREGVEPKKIICTLKVARRLFDFNTYKLQFLRYKLGLEIGEVRAHDAEGDIEVLEALFGYLYEFMQRENPGMLQPEIVENMLQWTSEPSLLKVLGFGKYKGQTFDEVSKKDRGYLHWLSGQSDLDEDLVYTLNRHLND